jgi:Flp pilus assembly secretin CpaC
MNEAGWSSILIATLVLFFGVAVEAQQPAKIPRIGFQEDTENVLVYPSIPVVVNKSVVVRLPRKANKVFVTQPQIAEVVVVAPDQLLINGKAVGATSLVVWFEEKTKARKQ